MVFFICLMAAGVAVALPVSVDFSTVSMTTDITMPNSLTLGKVLFRYDDFGSGVDTAQIDSAGIFGSTGGSLIFDFFTPADALQFNFSLLDVTGDIPDALQAIVFSFNGATVDSTTAGATFVPYDPANPAGGGDALGTLAYKGPMFDEAQMFFSTDASLFTVDQASYNPLPEPGTLALLGGALLGLRGWRRFVRK